MEQITVDKVERGEKSASINAGGKWYKVPLKLVSNYTVGRSYNVEVEPSDFNGKTYYWLKKTPKEAYNSGANEAAAPPLNPSYNQQPSAPPRQQASGDCKDAQIFVTGIVGRAMGSGKFETQDVALLTQAAVEAWNTHVRGKL